MSDFLTAVSALFAWQVLVIAVPCVVVIALVLRAEHRERKFAPVRSRESELTLAYIADVQRLEQATTVETARLRAGESA